MYTYEKEDLIEALIGAGADIKGFKTFKCPFHDDSSPSASIYERSGKWKFHCFACGYDEDLAGVEALKQGIDRTTYLKQNKENPESKLKVIQNYTKPETPIERRKIIDTPTDSKTNHVDNFIMHLWDKSAGLHKPLPVFYQFMEKITRSTMPGSVTLFCGSPGSGKSFFLNYLSIKLIMEEGVKVKFLALEENMNFHLSRTLAQLCENSRMLDPEWMLYSGERAIQEAEINSGFLKNYANNVITTAKAKKVFYSNVEKYLYESHEKGAEIVIIDPITVVSSVKDKWKEDADFVHIATKIAEETGLRLIVSTHPKQDKTNIRDMNNISGGASWERFVQNVFWMYSTDFYEEKTVTTPDGEVSYSGRGNRIIDALKARNGIGTPKDKFLFNFNKNTLGFEEVGLIMNKKC